MARPWLSEGAVANVERSPASDTPSSLSSNSAITEPVVATKMSPFGATASWRAAGRSLANWNMQ
jgi:hypothetical protein